MDYFHYCNAEDSEEQGEKRKQAPCRDPPHVKKPFRNLGERSYAAAIERGKKEPPCRGHPRLDEAYQKFVQDSHNEMLKYAEKNPDHFCKTCGLNLKYTKYLKASYQYEALILAPDDCKICGSTKGVNCDAGKHEEYHRENCQPIVFDDIDFTHATT
jgi:hypothetical protein